MSDAEKWVTMVVYFTDGARGEWVVTDEVAKGAGDVFWELLEKGKKGWMRFEHRRGEALLVINQHVNAITIYETPAP